jgi:hypothetical protein
MALSALQGLPLATSGLVDYSRNMPKRMSNFQGAIGAFLVR